jgi:hypothetical protein
MISLKKWTGRNLQINRNGIESIYLWKDGEYWFVDFSTISGKDIPHLTKPIRFKEEQSAIELYNFLGKNDE